jgi:hypothetical protein
MNSSASRGFRHGRWSAFVGWSSRSPSRPENQGASVEPGDHAACRADYSEARARRRGIGKKLSKASTLLIQPHRKPKSRGPTTL